PSPSQDPRADHGPPVGDPLMSSSLGGNGAPADALVALRGILENAIQLGAPAYDNADPTGCYEVYSCAARLVLATVQGAEDALGCLRHPWKQCAVVADPAQQAAALRQTFDQLLADAEPPPPLAQPDDDPLQIIQAYLMRAIDLGAPAADAGDLRGCYEVYACTARLLLHIVTGAEETQATLQEALEHCATLGDPDQQAWTMRQAFDSILAPTDAATLIDLYLTSALQIGDPAYNYGDYRGAYEIYACTARLVLHTIPDADDARAQLEEALRQCATTA